LCPSATAIVVECTGDDGCAAEAAESRRATALRTSCAVVALATADPEGAAGEHERIDLRFCAAPGSP
jgi:hypothetical protein